MGLIAISDAAIAPFARKHGYSVVTEFGGHGVGVDFHEEPFVCHDSKKNTGMLMVPGMVFTVEPMINAGRRDVFIDASNDLDCLYAGRQHVGSVGKHGACYRYRRGGTGW